MSKAITIVGNLIALLVSALGIYFFLLAASVHTGIQNMRTLFVELDAMLSIACFVFALVIIQITRQREQ